MSSATPIYRKDIDGLRAIAVLAVVLFHALPGVLPGGFVGVDVFFVISGFLISTIIFTKVSAQTFSFFDFYWRRVRRIFPALLLVMLSCFIAGWFILLPDEFKRLGRHLASGALFMSNYTLLDEAGYFNTASEAKPLLHLWSLAIEEQFYIIWPILISYAFRKKKDLLKTSLLFFSVSFIVCIFLRTRSSETAFFSPLSRFWEIAAGAILAYFSIKIPSLFSDKLRSWANALSLLGLVLIGMAIVLLNKDSSFPGFWALLPVIGTCLLIASGETSWLSRNVLSSKAFTAVGAISYPLYLWHWPVISFMHIKLESTLSYEQAMVAVLVSVVLAMLTYRVVETPLKVQKYSKPVFATLCYSMGFILILGSVTYFSDGFIQRLPEPIQKYGAIDFEWKKYARNGTCHIQDNQGSEHPAECFESERPLILLWGDSHGSSLYQGFDMMRGQYKFGMTQLTKANCAPLLNFNKASMPACGPTNDINLEVALKSKPEVILLNAYWSLIEGLNNESMIDKLLETIALLRAKLPASKIIILGPVPIWEDTLQKSLVRTYLAHPQEGVPNYLNHGMKPEIEDLDRAMAAKLEGSGAMYISAYQIFCGSQGCLARVGDEPQDLTAIDYGHLSRSGAKYLVEKIIGQVLK